MIFEAVASGGCRSYVIGCEETCAAALIDPELSQVDRYLALAARDGLRIRYLIDTHTHADHFSASQQLARQLDVPVVMHRSSPAPFVDLRLQGGELLIVGRLRLQALHTPGHTHDSSRRTNTRDALTRASVRSWPRTRDCSNATVAPSSR